MKDRSFLSITNYLLNEGKDCEYKDYVINQCNIHSDLFPPREIRRGMLKWNDESASSWGGPYPGNFVFCRITDYSIALGRRELMTIDEYKLHMVNYYVYSTFNVDSRSFKKYFPYGFTYGGFPQVSSEGQICGRYRFTHQELQLYLDSATEEELAYREEQIELSTRNIIIEDPTVEFPIRLYIAGNDDTSYSRFFATELDSLSELEYLITSKPNINYIHDNYIFTN